MPPTIGSEPTSMGKHRFSGASAAFSADRRRPAPTRTERSTRSSANGSVRRSVESTTCAPAASGVEAPTRPVFAPCGSTRMPARTQRATMAETSAVLRGRSTLAARPSPLRAPRS